MFTRSFKKLSKSDVDIAGGKGASLGEMTSAGIPVPAGFVVLSTAFEKFTEDTNIDAEIKDILKRIKHANTKNIEAASKKIQKIVLETEIPENIQLDIENDFKKLGAKYVAVRSSATSEDSSTDAWAGQLDSYLNTTHKELLDNIRKCWASLFTPRAIFYRFEKKLEKQKISVAVVVQKMVQSETSGVAFSVHPVTKNHNDMILEAVYGLGEAIVSGQVTPDTYIVTKNNFKISDKIVVSQKQKLVRSKIGNSWVNINTAVGSKQKITDKEILNLAKLVQKIEKHYKFPVDVEWAREGNRFYITQSRPITTLGL